MKTLFDSVSYDCSKIVTKSYSTSFSMATKMLASCIRQDIYNIYGFVRFADGSADVVGLMCLKVFVKGNQEKYDQLKDTAMSLGSAFQKVNFLRDLKADFNDLERTYFPNTDLNNLNEDDKQFIIKDIEHDFSEGLKGIKKLPVEAKFGVFMAYRYYSQLLKKLKKTPALEIKNTRIRVPNYKKFELLTRSYVKYQLNLL